jgi:hypothetical protein
MADGSDVEKGRLWHRIDEDVQVATVGVPAVQDGTEHSCIAGMVRFDHLTDCGTVQGQGFGWLHGCSDNKSQFARQVSRPKVRIALDQDDPRNEMPVEVNLILA